MDSSVFSWRVSRVQDNAKFLGHFEERSKKERRCSIGPDSKDSKHDLPDLLETDSLD